jgi:hypothetical protein
MADLGVFRFISYGSLAVNGGWIFSNDISREQFKDDNCGLFQN